jgi:hypothetical protein
VKTARMWRAGGHLCARCGCETDAQGRKVTALTPPAPFPALQWVAVAFLLLAGGGLGAALLLRAPATPARVVVPQPAPAVPPAN